MILYDVWYRGKAFDPKVSGEYIRRNVKPGEVKMITICGGIGRKLDPAEIEHLCATGRLLGVMV